MIVTSGGSTVSVLQLAGVPVEPVGSPVLGPALSVPSVVVGASVAVPSESEPVAIVDAIPVGDVGVTPP
ncbi:hypothetical protein, partial [Nannocystis pusilla]